MAKIRRPIIANAPYFITSVTYQRKQCFSRPQFAQVIVDQWKDYAQAYQFQLDAYSVMPDHYHAVLNVGEKKTISEILQAVHSYFSIPGEPNWSVIQWKWFRFPTLIIA